MKKLLIATTALVATAGVAAADVTLSGYGRFGLDYNGGAAAGTAKTQVNMRMRIDINGSMTTDSGVTFGGRFRIQHTDGQGIFESVTNTTPPSRAGSAAELNAAMLFATYGGLRMEVGNTNNAFDTVALAYATDLGYLDRSFGGPINVGAAYASGSYAAGFEDTMGIFASYNFGAGTVRISFKTPNQTTTASQDDEVQISADYNFGQFTVAAAYSDNTGFANVKDYFIGAEYAVNSDINVGLLHFSRDPAVGPNRNRTTLYGNYSMGAISYEGYIARDNSFTAANQTKTAFGLGMNYDLGSGARLGLDIHRNYNKDTIAGVGVRFNF